MFWEYTVDTIQQKVFLTKETVQKIISVRMIKDLSQVSFRHVIQTFGLLRAAFQVWYGLNFHLEVYR